MDSSGYAAKHDEGLISRWFPRGAEWMEARFKPFVSDYCGRYLHYVRSLHRYCDVQGISRMGPHKLELQRAYVELNLSWRRPSETWADQNRALPMSLRAGEHTIWDFLIPDGSEPCRLVIIGEPGAGKTTLLKFIALALAAESGRNRIEKAPNLIPVLLSLPYCADRIRRNPDVTLHAVVEESLDGFVRVRPPRGFWRRELESGSCLLMLDSLDSVADLQIRGKVAAWVQQQMANYSKSPFIVTARNHGYDGNPLNGVTVLDLCPLTLQQDRLAHNLCAISEMVAERREDERIKNRSSVHALDLLKRIHDVPAVRELAANPMAMTMLANIHGFRSVLPTRLGDLCGDSIEVSLTAFESPRGVTLDFSPNLGLTPTQERRLLQDLAYQMMCKGMCAIPIADASITIRGALREMNERAKPEDFLKSIAEESGILIERERGIIGFAHRLFQEYLAAVHAYENKLVIEMSARMGQSWWHQTMRFYCAMTHDAVAVIKPCLGGDHLPIDAIAMANECIEEAGGAPDDIRHRLEEFLFQEEERIDLEDNDPDIRKRAAERRLALRLRRMIRLDEDRQVSRGLVTHAEYQLFLDDQRALGIFCQPDHWTGLQFPPGMGKVPISGVRPGDVAEFCEWLTRREGGSEWFRPPTLTELNQADFKENLSDGEKHAYWAASADQFLCNPAGSAVPVLTLDALHRWLVRDRVLADQLDEMSGSTLYIERAMELPIASALRRAQDRPVHLEPAVDRENVRSLDGLLERAFQLARFMDHSNAIDEVKDRSRLAHDRACAGELGRALPLAIERILERKPEDGRDRKRDRAHARAMALALATVLADLAEHLPLTADRNEEMQEFSSMLCTHRDAYIDLYISLVTLEERIEGNLPAFESIRIVADRVEAGSSAVVVDAAHDEQLVAA